MMGDLDVGNYTPILAALPFLIVAFAVFALLPRTLNLLTHGRRRGGGEGRGGDARAALAFLSASLATGAAVSLGGPIGFIGIIVPHLVRLMVGSDHRVVLPAAALFGAAFTVLCDLVARTIMAPLELPVGIITALIGGPFFLWLLVKTIMNNMQNTKDTKITKPSINAFRGLAFVVLRVLRGSNAARNSYRSRIISLVPALTEMLFAIGAGPQVVAVSSYDEFPPEVKALPRVGALLDPDTERIISLKPDLVITYGSQVDLQTQMKRASVATFDYRHGGLDHILATMRELGQRTGHLKAIAGCGRRDRIAHCRGEGPRGRQAAPAHAAGVQPRSPRPAQRLRQRRPRLPARHAGGRRRPGCVRRHRQGISCRPPPRPSSRGRPR